VPKKSSERRTLRLQIELSAEDLEAITEYQFRMRIPSRSEAVRELLKRGMESEREEPSSKH